jgi:hypothetical protein
VRNVGKSPATFKVDRRCSAFSINEYPLKNSAILDSGSTLHVFNEISRFVRFRTASAGDYIWAGETKVKIQGYGDVDIQVQGPRGRQLFHLTDVALCENFACNIVSLQQLHKRGFWWDNRPGINQLRRSNGNSTVTVAFLEFHSNQFVLEHLPLEVSRSTFYARRNKFNSWTTRRPVAGDALKWHLRLGHPGPKVLEHLVNTSKGAKIRGPTTVQCDSCGTGKARKQIRREPKEIQEEPGVRLAIDFHDYQPSDKGFTSMMMVTDRWTGFIWDYYLEDRTAVSIITALKHLFGMLERQYKVKPKIIECDHEIVSRKHAVRNFIKQDQHMILEPSAVNTQSQNGAAERSAGVIKDKSRTMRIGAKLPYALWPEVNRAAVYLYNRSPRCSSKWITPYDAFHTFLAQRDKISLDPKKPQQAHLKTYGCKAFAMTKEAQLKKIRLQRFDPKAWIGFLVGYDSTNNYRIWNPSLNKVVSTRDVVFNEDAFFSGDVQQLKDDLLHVNVNELSELLKNISQPGDTVINTVENQEQEGPVVLGGFDAVDDDLIDAEDLPPIQVVITNPPGLSERLSKESYEPTADELAYPTPESTPPASLLASSIENDDPTDLKDDQIFEAWKAAFTAGALVQHAGTLDSKPIDRARIQRILRKPNGLKDLHRHDLPPEPEHHHQLEGHPLGTLFEQAEKDHLKGHEDMNTWTEISRSDIRVRGKQILDCRWVYLYKFDKHGRLVKCKARLVVRGDQQLKTAIGNTYAATLAVRSFRTLVAIAAKFDLELIQYDAVNAFVNADLDEEVFMKSPPGHRKPGKILSLNKALFGLRKSPLLWQKKLTSVLQSLGFQPVPHEPCCMTYRGVIIFFYVDDIALAYKLERSELAKELVNQIRKHFDLTGGDPLQWFLGIRVIRDREKRLIWLSQSTYIDKIANLAETNQGDSTPMTRDELLPHEALSSKSSINRYQRKIGSLLYAAVTTRPDIAFAVSRLSRFLTNPSPEHHAAADRILLYLKKHKHLGLQFGGGEDYEVSSDASFADNTLDRKSSQAYAMQLFGGLIGWRANKQDTVTTSTTEAELLALSQAAKEGIYVSRLLLELGVRLDDHRIRLLCDNTQTIRLVNDDIARLQTRLRHVDIHNHWLRQEAQKGAIIVRYTPSESMIADGLTKALPKDGHRRFLNQVRLVDIQIRLEKVENSSPARDFDHCDPSEVLWLE